MSPDLRRSLLAAAGLAALALTACGRAAPPKSVVLFVDASASVADRSRYDAAWAALTDSAALGAGDRLVVARIDGATYDAFRPAADVTLPAFDPLVDNPIVARERAAAARRGLTGALDTVLAGAPAQRTDVLSALTLGGKLLAGDGARRRRIVLLSDMLQDDGRLDFSRGRVPDGLADSLVAALRRDGALPDLRGDTVIVAGATDRPDVQRFWTRVVEASGGTLRAADYGPALMGYRP